MTTTILIPASRADWINVRHPTVGASESPAMLGVHPKVTPFELWARKSSVLIDRDNRFKRRGRLLEPIGVQILREERPDWAVTPNIIGEGGKFYQDIEAGISCTPDVFVFDSTRVPTERAHSWQEATEFVNRAGTGVCNIKTVDPYVFRKDWMIDGAIQLPVYVAIQAMQEMYLTGASWGCVGAVVGFDLGFHLIDVELHGGVIERIKRAAADFLRRVRENDPPPPDYARDGDAIRGLYADDSGGVIDLSGNERIAKLAARHLALKEIESAAYAAKKERDIIDPEIIEALGNAQCGTINGLLIEAKTVRRHYKATEAHITSSRPVKIKTASASA